MSKLGESHGYTPPAAMPEYLIRHTTLRQLQIFEATVRLGSFTKAAEELFLTQPTVSMQIKKLSDVMGIPLFEHIGRKVKPTEAGSELYESCCKMFEVLANLEMTLSDIKGIKRGRLRIGVVSTMEHVEKKQLQYALAETLSPGFLASDMNEVKQAVESLPWVADAQVRRIWPEQVEVLLTEKEPVANWLQNGFLDSNLVAFFPANRTADSELPKLAGPKGAEQDVWRFYQAILQQVRPLNLDVDVVSMARHGAWSAHFRDGPWVLLGKEQTSARLDRLASVYHSLEERWQDVRLIDLRYPNGFSVEWSQ